MALTNSQIRRLKHTDPNEAGNRIASAAEILGVTQREIAVALGLSQSQLSDIARGRYPDITLGNAKRLAAFFGCSVDDLFPGKQAA